MVSCSSLLLLGVAAGVRPMVAKGPILTRAQRESPTCRCQLWFAVDIGRLWCGVARCRQHGPSRGRLAASTGAELKSRQFYGDMGPFVLLLDEMRGAVLSVFLLLIWPSVAPRRFICGLYHMVLTRAEWCIELGCCSRLAQQFRLLCCYDFGLGARAPGGTVFFSLHSLSLHVQSLGCFSWGSAFFLFIVYSRPRARPALTIKDCETQQC